ncbi:MAG: HAD family hydrolase [Candidatus Limnocylindrales bacterium]
MGPCSRGSARPAGASRWSRPTTAPRPTRPCATSACATGFAALVCGDDGFPVKPAPDAIFALCQALGTVPDRVAVVGDSPADIAMGRAAGAGVVIGVRSGIGRDEDLGAADVILDSVAAFG